MAIQCVASSATMQEDNAPYFAADGNRREESTRTGETCRGGAVGLETLDTDCARREGYNHGGAPQ
eukprot:3455104-Amphidinium_carterae.2